MKKLILLARLLLLFFIVGACENDKPIEPNIENPPTKQRLFDVEVGTEWNMSKGTEKASMKVLYQDTMLWALSYWDTNTKVSLKTFALQWKYFDKGFPRYISYALAETDSGYFFGTNWHYLVSPHYPEAFVVNLFFLPDTVNINRIESNELLKNILGEDRYWKYQARWISLPDVVADSIARKAWQIDYLAEQKAPAISKMGESLSLMEKVGFLKFRSYNLDSISIR